MQYIASATNITLRSRLAALGILLAAAMPAAAMDLRGAISAGEIDLGVRYRFEHVDLDRLARQAKASTARARMTWNSAVAGAFSFGIEADYVFVLGLEDYNSTTNGRFRFPVVADPQGFDLNQAFVAYQAQPFLVRVGRQRINHGGQRFLGGVAWRQNEQTYDAVRILYPNGRFDVDYAYIHNVNRIFGPDDGAQPGDWYGNMHVLRAALATRPKHTLTAFGYLFDLTNANGPPNANITAGLDYQGAFGRVAVRAAVARQSDAGDNPVSYNAGYYNVEATLDLAPVTVTAAIETLGSDGGRATFRTPLATLHKFQGWTDQFLQPPATGVRDSWIQVSGKAFGTPLTVAYHDFRAAHGSADYGSEVNVSVARDVGERWNLLFKLAHYSADEHASDTTKFWVMVDWRL